MRSTRYKELGYDTFGRDHWQFVDASTGSQIGVIYATKGELLADLPRFATEFGCAAATAPKAHPPGLAESFAEDFPTLAEALSEALATAEAEAHGDSGRMAYRLGAVLADASRVAVLTSQASAARGAGRVADALALESDRDEAAQGLPDACR